MTGPTDAELAHLVDQERARRAADERRASWWRGRRADEEATLADTLVGLAERGAPLLVRAIGGATCRGRAEAVGVDHLVLVADDGSLALVPLAAIATVQADGHQAWRASARPVPPRRGLLVDALRDLVEDRRWARLHLADGRRVDGELTACGADAATVVTGDRGAVHLHLHLRLPLI